MKLKLQQDTPKTTQLIMSLISNKSMTIVGLMSIYYQKRLLQKQSTISLFQYPATSIENVYFPKELVNPK